MITMSTQESKLNTTTDGEVWPPEWAEYKHVPRDKETVMSEIRNGFNLLRPNGGYDHYWRRGCIRDFFRWLRHMPKNVWHRAKYGWCKEDMWDMDKYFAYAIITAMRQLGQHTYGCPTEYVYPNGVDEGDDPDSLDKWKADVLDEADRLEEILYDYEEGIWTYEEREQKTKEAFEWLRQHWFDLWD